MPAQALYLKYRPRSFDQVEGQDHITRTLKNALALGRVSHAYLFTGPRGTGKTTMARILAKAVNCLAEKENEKPDNTCAICRAINEERLLDLIEIDAASNRGIDNIRELREKVGFRPSDARYRVYVVDEVHMLTVEAFNALLKTLEEPPPHVIFVLATTDPQKIPATVLSRVQRLDFRRLTIPEIIARLREIAEKEKLKTEPAALEIIARYSGGGMRDAISLLDQLASYGSGEVTLAQVENLLGAASRVSVNQLIGALARKEVGAGLTVIANTIDGGADPRQFAREIVEYLRALLLAKAGNVNALPLTAEAQTEIQELAELFSIPQILLNTRLFNQAAYELRASTNPTLPLELAFVEAIADPIATERAPFVSTPRESPRPAPIVRETKSIANVTAVKTEPAEAKKNIELNKGETLSVETLNANWSRVLDRIKVYNKIVAAMLHNTEFVKVEGDLVVLGFHYEAHAEKFEKQANGKTLIERSLREIFEQPYRVKCILSPKKAKLKAVEQDPLVQEARKMGGEISRIHD
ncbi:MAG: DNA polymerase III subunit gamma/tau [Chloroflexi bacterium]|nr:DNA polymerase III subunit gamma/tau [Chloroflexota bacterium]